MTPKLRQWRWPELATYNGFTHIERVKGWQVIWWLIDNGHMPRPTVCCISGSTEKVTYHCEDYYRPWEAYPLASPLHLALHQRFNRPRQWEAIVGRYAITGAEWFANLSPTPVDFAGDLRRLHGDDMADIFGRVGINAATCCNLHQCKKTCCNL